jgi:hypothetical protein
MVVGGTMRVSATVGGVPKDTTDTIAVSPRTWAGMMPYPSALPSLVLTPDRFRDIPVRDSAGIDVWLKGGLAVYEYGINWRGRLNQVPSGPNHGYWYFTQPPPWLNPEVLYSGYLDPGNPFYEAQTGQRAEDPAAPSGYTRGWCEKTDMDVLRQEVFYHEGNVSGPRLSHHQLNKDYTAKHDPAPKVESVVFYLTDQSVSLAKRMDSELGAAYLDQLALAHESQVHAPTNLYTVPCKVHIP